MPSGLSAPQVRVLRALRDGMALTMYMRSERGPYYTLAGRRLSMTLLKDLERQRYISRSAALSRSAVDYELTPDGQAALAQWEGVTAAAGS